METFDFVGEGLPLSVEELTEKVHSGFSKKYQEQLSKELISETILDLNLSQSESGNKTPLLLLHRLVFSGEKTYLTDETLQPFRFDQAFSPGVNVFLIKDNNVGKSSIMKTLKFALTGDDSTYDADVKSWIKYIWLHFSVGNESFTIHIIRGIGPARAVLVGREEFRDLTVIEDVSNKYFDVTGGEIQSRLQQFFFDRYGLKRLSWTHNNGEKRNLSWKTFFQALTVPDSSDQYLLCDPQHAMGNQEGLILSTFMGLRLVQALNALSVEFSSLNKQNKLTEEEINEAKETISSLDVELKSIREKIGMIETRKSLKFQSLKTNDSARRGSEISHKLIEVEGEKAHVENQIQNLSNGVKRCNAGASSLRQAIVLKKHFTGLEVSLCPNCDAGVEEEAIQKEHDRHTCRLCNKPASPADPKDIEDFTLQALNLESDAKKHKKTRAKFQRQLTKLVRQCETLKSEGEIAREISNKHLDIVLAEAGEEDRLLADLYAQSGQIKGKLRDSTHRAQMKESIEEIGDTRKRIIDKIRKVLREEAILLNKNTLSRLSELVQEMITTIGTESIHSLECSPYGKITLSKHGEKVSFTRINNPGERVRLKLAFFLSMMCLGREPGLGRHPGFLMIDQLGTSEMVSEDCNALAKTLKKLDKDLSKSVQLICFTARSEFSDATEPHKIYGSQSDGKAF